jgi:DNA-binding FadR family transcriptional regulator
MSGPTVRATSHVPALPLGDLIADRSAKDLLSETTAAAIVERIESGEFPPGARLPAERELARDLGVSRIVVREAFSALQAMGMVEAHVGRGRFVAGNAREGRSTFFVQRWLQVHQTELEELSLVRQILETAAVRDVPRDRCAEVGAKLRSILTEATAAAARGEAAELAHLDGQFHTATVELASNRPLRALSIGIIEMVHPSAVAVMSVPAAREASLAEHERIVHAFESSDIELATILIGHHQDSGHRRAREYELQ